MTGDRAADGVIDVAVGPAPSAVKAGPVPPLTTSSTTQTSAARSAGSVRRATGGTLLTLNGEYSADLDIASPEWDVTCAAADSRFDIESTASGGGTPVS